MTDRDIPTSSDHWVTVAAFPPNEIIRLDRLLLDCSFLVAHLQFSGLYPKLLFLLSKVCDLEGLRPMSDRKVS